MPSLSTIIRIILGCIATIAGVIAGLIGNVLSINVIYFFTKRGRKPTKRSAGIWFVFFISALVFVILGSVAAFAPPLLANQLITATATEIQVIAQLNASTPTPTIIPFTPTPEFQFAVFDQFETVRLGKWFTYMDLNAPPEIKNGYMHFDYMASGPYDNREILADLEGNRLNYLVAEIAVDESSHDSFAYMQIQLGTIDEVFYYINFGVMDTSEIFISQTADREGIGKVIFVTPGQPQGQFDNLAIAIYPLGMRFYVNDNSVYSMDSAGGSFYLGLFVGGSGNSYIKSRWDWIAWSYDK